MLLVDGGAESSTVTGMRLITAARQGRGQTGRETFRAGTMSKATAVAHAPAQVRPSVFAAVCMFACLVTVRSKPGKGSPYRAHPSWWEELDWCRRALEFAASQRLHGRWSRVWTYSPLQHV